MDAEFIIPRLFDLQQQFHYLKVDDFSCVEYRTSSETRQNRILVTSFLFVVVLSGEKIIHLESGDLHIGAGNAFFATKGAYIFSEILKTNDEYRTLVFFIDDRFLTNFLKSRPGLAVAETADLPEQIFQIHLTPLLQAGIQSLLPYFLHESTHRDGLMQLKLEEVLLHIIDADSGGRFQSFLHGLHSGRKQNLLQLMEKYYHKPLKLQELAELSGRSLSSFKRDFRELFQQTPRQWINDRRLEQARALLLGSDSNVSETCFEVGFENISHFSQLFKRKYGCSPSALRQ